MRRGDKSGISGTSGRLSRWGLFVWGGVGAGGVGYWWVVGGGGGGRSSGEGGGHG